MKSFFILGINSSSKYLYPIDLKFSIIWSSTNQNILIKRLKEVLNEKMNHLALLEIHEMTEVHDIHEMTEVQEMTVEQNLQP